MVNDADIATHTDPVLRERANFIVRLDLAKHGMPGKYEQMWTRADDYKHLFDEFRAGNHYAAVDLPPGIDDAAVIATLAPLAKSGALTWEWAGLAVL